VWITGQTKDWEQRLAAAAERGKLYIGLVTSVFGFTCDWSKTRYVCFDCLNRVAWATLLTQQENMERRDYFWKSIEKCPAKLCYIFVSNNLLLFNLFVDSGGEYWLPGRWLFDCCCVLVIRRTIPVQLQRRAGGENMAGTGICCLVTVASVLRLKSFAYCDLITKRHY